MNQQFALAHDGSHGVANRSEEHTSELQSRLHLVCRLLLEKKKALSQTSHSFPRSLRLPLSNPAACSTTASTLPERSVIPPRPRTLIAREHAQRSHATNDP